MPSRDIIVIGASAGGVEALRELVAGMPQDLRAALFAVVHTSAEAPDVLAQVLNRASKLPAITAVHRAEILPGRVYLAPPDRHMLLERGQIRLSRDATENRSRPAIDPLFISAAKAYGPRVVGVLLTGYLDDGAAGLAGVKREGGVVIVQDPDDAMVPDMPRNALDCVAADYVLPLSEMPPILVSLVSEPVKEKVIAMVPKKSESKPSVFTCPECSGTLFEATDTNVLRFRCRVGHTYSPGSMYAEQGDAVERALWAATRALEERAQLSARLAERSREQKRNTAAERYRERAEASKLNAGIVRDLLLKGDFTGPAELEEPHTGT